MGTSHEGYIFNLKKFAIHDGPGIRTTIFFQGCPMHCRWCHNPESIPFDSSLSPGEPRNCLRPFYRSIPYRNAWQVSVEELMTEILKDRIFYEESGGGVTLSGGEPFVQPEFLIQLLRRCKQEHLHTAVDTSGHLDWQWLEKVSPDIDLFLYDLKLMDDEKHRAYTGVSNHRILENLRRLSRLREGIIPRIPLVPGITDTGENLTEMARFLKTLPGLERVDLLSYNPMAEGKYKKLKRGPEFLNLKHQSEKQLEQMRHIFESRGFKVFIGG